MSRGFVKEGDQEEAPMIPPRAALPEGEINYVTPRGLSELKAELEELEEERSLHNEINEAENRRKNMLIDGKINLLKERLASARVIDPADQPRDEVRFGATVELAYLNGPLKGKSQRLQITGVDEADVKQQKIAFVAPLARATMGKGVGEEYELQLGSEIRRLKVLGIGYE